ncbi:MAG TPA: hypothetical protein VGD56_08500, partial [Gemmatirosa sp.]
MPSRFRRPAGAARFTSGARLVPAAVLAAACARPGAPLVGPPVGGQPFDKSILAGAADPWRALPAPFWTMQSAPDARGASLRGVHAVSA